MDVQNLTGQLDDQGGIIESDKDRKTKRDRQKLLDSLAAGDFKNLLPRVAYILNCFPETRNSDIKLCLAFWKFFQPELYHHAGILPENLFKLERQSNLTRVRAKIQNEFNLFLADEAIRNHRRKNEETMEQAVIDVQPEVGAIRIFSDETGKTGGTETFLIVASIWVLNGHTVYQITQAINEWKAKHNWRGKELHFNQIKRQQTEAIFELIETIASNREYLSFKSVAIQHRNLKRRPVENAVLQLHERMVKYGLDHELSSRRIGLPKVINLTMDHETSIDGIALDAMKQEVSSYFQPRYGDSIKVGVFATVDSETSALVQLADMLAGSLNRRYNTPGSNHLDEIAQQFLTALDINLTNRDDGDEIDSYTMIKL